MMDPTRKRCVPVTGTLAAALLTLLLMAGASPAATLQDFICYEGTPVVDGVLTPGEYAGQARVFYKYFRRDARIEVYLNYDNAGIYLGIMVEDDNLWADGPGDAYTTHVDDNVEWYMDPQNSADAVIMPDDTVWAMKVDGNGRLDAGTGEGTTISRVGGQFHEKVSSAVTVTGTINNPSDVDTGFVMETFLTWEQVAWRKPADGEAWNMSIIFTEDDDGGAPNDAFTEFVYDAPHVVDEMVALRGDSIYGPVNWPTVVFSARDDTTAPAAVTSLSASTVRPWSATLSFAAPGDNGAIGRAFGYDIRYAKGAITTEDDWTAATRYDNDIVPAEPGSAESIRIIGLFPETSYTFMVRARDERGNLAPLGGAATATTTAASTASTTRGLVGPGPFGRRLAYEDGTAFNMIGHHISVSGTYINTCYNGPLGVTGANFYEERGGYDDAVTYLKQLRAEGKNTMRIFLEDLTLLEIGAPPSYAGLLEWPATTDGSGVNEAMIGFLKNLLDAAEQADMYIIVSMYDTFHYPGLFHLTPWASANGGPLTSRFQFYDPEFYAYHKARLKALVEAGRNYESLLAWEVGNEYDGTWAEDVPLSTREAWLKEMAAYVRSLDPAHAIISSSASWDFRREAAVFPYEDDTYLDWLNLHMYPLAGRDPERNPDDDKSIRPALEVNRNLKFHFCRMSRDRAITDDEFGPEDTYITSYSSDFTFADDVAMTHHILWAEVAGGVSGAGLRGQGKIFSDYGSFLPDEMTDHLKVISTFYKAGGVDWLRFGGATWDENMRLINSTGETAILMGWSDGRQGVGWLMVDTRTRSASFSGASRLFIDGLEPGRTYVVEFWDTSDTTATGPVKKSSAMYSPDGKIAYEIPAFTSDLAVKWYESDVPSGRLDLSRGAARAGDTLRVTAAVSSPDGGGWDDYVGVMLPTGELFTLSALNTLEASVVPLRSGAEGPAGEAAVMDLTLPALMPGTYTFYHAVTAPGGFATMYSLEAAALTVVE